MHESTQKELNISMDIHTYMKVSIYCDNSSIESFEGQKNRGKYKTFFIIWNARKIVHFIIQ